MVNTHPHTHTPIFSTQSSLVVTHAYAVGTAAIPNSPVAVSCAVAAVCDPSPPVGTSACTSLMSQTFSGNCTHRPSDDREGYRSPRWKSGGTRKTRSRLRPALSFFFGRSYVHIFIYFRCPSCSSPLSPLCLRCTTSDEVVTLTRTHVIWDSRTRVPNQPF